MSPKAKLWFRKFASMKKALGDAKTEMTNLYHTLSCRLVKIVEPSRKRSRRREDTRDKGKAVAQERDEEAEEPAEDDAEGDDE